MLTSFVAYACSSRPWISGWRRGCFHDGQRFEDGVAMVGFCGNEPGIARAEIDGLTLEFKLGSAGEDISHGLVVALGRGLGLVSRLFLP